MTPATSYAYRLEGGRRWRDSCYPDLRYITKGHMSFSTRRDFIQPSDSFQVGIVF